jgi:hypothetical protein
MVRTGTSEWIEAWYNPARRHSALGYHSSASYETMHSTAHHDSMIITANQSGKPGKAHCRITRTSPMERGLIAMNRPHP